MLNPKIKLNPKVFNDDVEQIPIRKGFGEGLLFAGTENQNIIALCADLTESTQMQLFKDKFPKRFIEIGVAEQNLASVASGMAAMGKIPVISSYAMFSPGRNWEQIRTTICYNNQKVIIAGSHAGISVGPDGGTHQAIEDIALMRIIPNIDVISPCDAIEAKKAFIAAIKTQTPTYIRLAREKTPIITVDETPFSIGKANLVWVPEIGLTSVGIVVTGALVHKALHAAKQLEKEKGIKTKVLNLHTIKPLDTDALLLLAKECQAIVTVEEHQIAGGMGSAVAEFFARTFPIPIEFVGVHDLFGQSGTPEQLLTHYHLDIADIKNAVITALNRKRRV